MAINSGNVLSILTENSENQIIERMSQHPEEAQVVYDYIMGNPPLIQRHKNILFKANEYKASTTVPDDKAKISSLYAGTITGKPITAPSRWHSLTPVQMRQFVDSGGNVNLRDDNGDTLLYYASFYEDVSLVKALLIRGADPNISNLKLQTPLIIASSKGNSGIAELLLQHGAKPDHVNAEGHRAIHFAVFYGHRQLTYFLSSRCDLNAQNVDGDTPLMLACYRGYRGMVLDLLYAKADPLIPNQKGETCLEIAEKMNHLDIITLLMDFLPPKVIKSKGPMLIHQAAKTNNDELLKMLFKLGIDPDSRNANGETPLMSSIRAGAGKAFWTIFDAGANVEAEDNAGRRALTHAMVWRESGLCQRLIDRRVKTNYTDRNQLSVLDYALLYMPNQVNRLISLGADINLSVAWKSLLDKDKVAIMAKIDEKDLLTALEIGTLQKQVQKHLTLSVRSQCLSPYSAASRTRAAAVAQACKRRVDLAQLKQQEPQKWSRLQQERTIGSNTLTGGKPNERRSAEAAWESMDAVVRQWAMSKTPLTFENICEINQNLNPQNARCGRLRSRGIKAGDSPFHCYIDEESVAKEMEDFCRWLDAEVKKCDDGTENPIEVAARAYQWMVSIHPFDDGNGRTWRMVMDYVLQRAGLPPAAMGTEICVAVFSLMPQNKTSDDCLAAVMAGVEKSHTLLE